MIWTSIITNQAYTATFLGGSSESTKLIPGLPITNNVAYSIAARYNLVTKNYVWMKAFVDSQKLTSAITSLALNDDESCLAMAGSMKDSPTINTIKTIFVYLVDPKTGMKKYSYFTS